MAIKHIVAGVALAAFAGLGAYVYLGEGAQQAPQTQFVLLDGSSKTTQDLRGKVTLVNFWATSCTTCVAEMPEIVATYNKYKDQGYDTLAVAMSYDPPSYVLNFAQGLGRCQAHADHLHRQQAGRDCENLYRPARLCGAAPAD